MCDTHYSYSSLSLVWVDFERRIELINLMNKIKIEAWNEMKSDASYLWSRSICNQWVKFSSIIESVEYQWLKSSYIWMSVACNEAWLVVCEVLLDVFLRFITIKIYHLLTWCCFQFFERENLTKHIAEWRYKSRASSQRFR